jgi:hypothetical protein
MEDVGIYYGHLVHFTIFCYIVWVVGIGGGNFVYFSVLVFCTKKNLATPARWRLIRERKIVKQQVHAKALRLGK